MQNGPPPKFTVVIPTLGTRSGALQRCVESVLWHQRDDAEILIVDDCTPDDSVHALTKALGTAYFRRPVNGGVAAAQNSGIEAARGEFIMFLHSDDELAQEHPWCTDEQAVVTGGLVKSGVAWRSPVPSASGKDFLLHRFGVHISAFVFPRAVLTETSFDSTLRSWEDWDLLYRLVLKGVRFRETEGPFAVIHADNNDRLSVSPHMATALKTLYAKHGQVRADRRIRAGWEFKIGRLLIRTGSVDEGRTWLRKSMRTDPLHPRRMLSALRMLISGSAGAAQSRL